VISQRSAEIVPRLVLSGAQRCIEVWVLYQTAMPFANQNSHTHHSASRYNLSPASPNHSMPFTNQNSHTHYITSRYNLSPASPNHSMPFANQNPKPIRPEGVTREASAESLTTNGSHTHTHIKANFPNTKLTLTPCPSLF
jgi:hypothetical protein